MAGNWIQSAIKHPGTLREMAAHEGAMTKGGTIRKEWLFRAAKRKGKVGQRARLALTLGKMH